VLNEQVVNILKDEIWGEGHTDTLWVVINSSQ